jgi:hypothetical protein
VCAVEEKVESVRTRTYDEWHTGCAPGKVIDVKRYRRQLQELLCLGLVMSLAHGVLLCVGCDGHAELHSGLHAHDHTGAAVPPERHAGDDHTDGHSHCSRCVDIPVSMFVVDGQIGSVSDPLVCLSSAGCDVTQVRAELWASRREYSVSVFSYFTPLSSIILVV